MLILPKSAQFALKTFGGKWVPQERIKEKIPPHTTNTAVLEEKLSILTEKLHAYESSKGKQGVVIKRDPSMWDAFLWIEAPDLKVNSPVVFGDALIGVVEEVRGRKGLVRLITDEQLPVAVRVSRGVDEERLLTSKVDELLEYLSLRLLSSHDTSLEELYTLLKEKKMKMKKTPQLLAKGVIRGRSSPLWRSYSYRLVGEGFNYDFADEEGPPLDLRSGIPYTSMGKETPKPLIQVGDTLITTGYDGIFPRGLLVGYVTKVYPLEEGATAYAIEAAAAAGSLHELSHVTVLDPVFEETAR